MSAEPSIDFGFGETTWVVSAVVERKFRTDTTLDQVFTVYDDRASEAVDPVESGLFADPPGEQAHGRR